VTNWNSRILSVVSVKRIVLLQALQTVLRQVSISNHVAMLWRQTLQTLLGRNYSFNGGQIIYLFGEFTKDIHNGFNREAKKMKWVLWRMEYDASRRIRIASSKLIVSFMFPCNDWLCLPLCITLLLAETYMPSLFLYSIYIYTLYILFYIFYSMSSNESVNAFDCLSY